MASGSAKVHLKLGHLELSYEGDPSFLGKDVFELIAKMENAGAMCTSALPAGLGSSQAGGRAAAEDSPWLGSEMTTNTVASILGVNTGPELAMAAAARLALGLGKSRFTRAEVRTEMKAAQSFHKDSYSRNLVATLSRLVKLGRLRLVGRNEYALSNDEWKALSAKLPGHP